MEKTQGGTQVTFDVVRKLFACQMEHSFVEWVQTAEHGRVLLMDGEVQFAESDEHRYHEMLVHPVMMLACDRLDGESPRVLILGGGDGLAAREVLKWCPASVDIVDYDNQFVDAFGMDLLRDLNESAFYDKCVVYHHDDARKFLKRGHTEYDVILVDLPDPDGPDMERLYVDVLAGCAGALRPGGCLSVHVGGLALNQSNHCWAFLRSFKLMIETLFPSSRTHLRAAYIPSFMNPWGFLYVVPSNIRVETRISDKLTRYWDVENPAHTVLTSRIPGLDKDLQALL